MSDENELSPQKLILRIGRNLSHQRKIRGLSLDDLLERIKVERGESYSRRIISPLESGIFYSFLASAIIVLGIDGEDLLDDPDVELEVFRSGQDESIAKSQTGGWDSFRKYPVSPDQIENAATSVYEYADSHEWPEKDTQEVIDILFSDVVS